MASEEKIRELAYSIWEKEGYPNGKDAEHYYLAKQILEEQEAIWSNTSEPTVPAVSTLQPPSAPKTDQRRIVKRHSKKAQKI